MRSLKKHVVFDVVGTCVSFDAYYSCIESVMGDKLRKQCIKPQHFGFTWQTVAELEFTFLSISERYTQYKDVLRTMFYRSLYMAGISEPRSFATDEERERCIEGYSSLQVRPGCLECFQKLRAEGFDVWCFTTGDIQRVKGYFERAEGFPLDGINFITCDTKGIAKPALAAYRSVLQQFKPEEQKWFAAAHMWDVSAAVRSGFTGAYCTLLEKEPCLEVFDVEMKVIADSLPEMAESIVKLSKTERDLSNPAT